MIKIDDFLKISEKISNKKKQLINAFKKKLYIDKSKLKIVIVSSLDYSRKERLQILLPEVKISTLAIKEVDIAIISIYVYYAACKLKGS